jgi:histidine ammonia-lyase
VTNVSARSLLSRLYQRPAELTTTERERMEASADRLDRALKEDEPVYGLTRGFGPLVRYAADNDGAAQGLGLINHLAAGQGPPLARHTTSLMLRLRLAGMALGFSAIRPGTWKALAGLLDAGIVPVVPAKGSVSASGDLIPLAHAALALAGEGQVWCESGSGYVPEPAAEALRRHGLKPIVWQARDALAFVNGSSASLAVALENQVALLAQAWAAAVLTGAIVEQLGASTEPYEETVAIARGDFAGHHRANGWIREQLRRSNAAPTARVLQEPYSMRCAPQIIGSVLDHLDACERLLVQEALGCSDNPVVSADAVLHAGNFHAINAGLVSDTHSLLVHQLAFLAERQLAVLVEPALNGGLPALLAGNPGATSGLAGVQIAASGLVAEMRQKGSPATMTALPTNMHNQDIVPMSLVGALRTRELLDLAGLVSGSLALAVAQIHHLGGGVPVEPALRRVMDLSPRLGADRSLADEVRQARDLLVSAGEAHT